MTKTEAIWHANHVFNIVIERCINAQNLKDAREFDEAKQIVIQALKQDKVLCLGDLENKCKHCTVKGETKHYCYCDIWGSVVNPRGWCNYGEREEIEQDEEQAAIEQLEHDLKYEPTFSNEDGSM